MPKSASSNSNNGPSFQAPRYRPNWLAAVICFVLGPSLMVALIDYSPNQVTLNTTHATATNIVGTFGADAIWCLYWTFGVAAVCIPLFLFWILYAAIRHPRRITPARLVAMLVCILAISGLAAMVNSPASEWFPNRLGGFTGSLLFDRLLVHSVGLFGSGLLLVTISSCGFVFVFTRDIGAELERALAAFHAWRDARAKRKTELAAARAKAREEGAKQKAAAAAAPPPAPVGPPLKKITVPKTADEPLAKPPAPVLEPPPAKPVIAAPSLKLGSKAAPAVPVIHKPVATAKAPVEQHPGDDYKRFPLPLLKEQTQPPENSDEEHMRNMADLVRILGEFGVEVKPGEIQVGPVITCYEVVPAAGVRVEKIAGLDKNIALGMRAQSVRILAPIPGKAAVGVEIPNSQPTPVGIREILESQDWRSARAEIPIALGKDVSGTPLISDLTKMPHLLIAGATGSGKSVCINSIIASIVYRKSPRDVRLIMVDPKVVELKIFNVLPHMLIEVVTEPKKVPGALKWLLGEMEKRYQQFAKAGVRNITGFNNRKKHPPAGSAPADVQPTLDGITPADDTEELPEHLPYIVVIIDELADLMMIAPADIETSIARLAQLARAAGIHLIIATQRPSVNVITGVIKANLPSRIAFQVASQVDSRTILDVKGADNLIGRGDMLFSPPGSSRLVRAQGAFVSDDEVHEFVKFLKENNPPPALAQEVQAHIDRSADEEDDEDGEGDDADLGDDEELYQQAIEVLKSSKRASTSMLQRRLRVGYNRAARIMEIMEDKGIVGPENGSSPREILVDLDSL
ncbi:MAG TPA: DNA translocase FtsK 4TM domain-containing protein [Opitutus sp.]|nr:DNA translocase FtsK 4TM domain-containing protein [Opitutus sp.]